MFKSTKKLALTASIILSAVSTSASAGLTLQNYSQGFESFTVSDPGAPVDNGDLGSDGWEVVGNQFDGTDTEATPWPGNYVEFLCCWEPAPNSGGGAFSAVATGDDTNGNVGSNYLNIYSNYDNRAIHDNPPTIINAIVARQYDIAAADIGKKLTFTFDAKRPDLDSDGFGGDNSSAAGNNCAFNCSAQAFLKTLDPSSGYSVTNEYYEVTTSISQAEWTTFTLVVELTDPALEGQILQLGFESFATNNDNTGVYYDNIEITLETVSGPQPEATNVPIPTIALLGFGALLAWSGMSSIRKRLS